MVLGGPGQHSGWLLLSRSSCQSCPDCTQRLCSGAGAYRSLSGRGWWASQAGLSLCPLCTVILDVWKGDVAGLGSGAVGCPEH